MVGTAVAGTIAHPTPGDPLLDGGDTASCAAQTDYAAGADVQGRPVAAADVAAAPVPVPDEIAVPLSHGQNGVQGHRQTTGTTQGEGAYVSLDGKKLAPLLNPKPCH